MKSSFSTPLSSVKKKIKKTSTHVTSTQARTKKKTSPFLKTIKKNAKMTLRSILLSHTFHKAAKLIVIAFMLGGASYGAYSFIGTTFAKEVVISKSEILSRIGKLITIPSEEPYNIVRVQDGEDLKKQNEFYKDIKEGDYIVIYHDLAIIYDLRNDVIIATKRIENSPR